MKKTLKINEMKIIKAYLLILKNKKYVIIYKKKHPKNQKK